MNRITELFSIFIQETQNTMQHIITAEPEHHNVWLEMATDLWPDYITADLESVYQEIMRSEKFEILLYQQNGSPIGFIYLGLRADYVEGSDSSPTGYVEGIYVNPDFRKKGIAKALYQAGETWAKQRGCSQMAQTFI
ncbi:MAG TPA: GNAT family N-acetyltransferase [Pedobacter sp.]|uniref:GNAT family N-acetyltransferase n=1 Tax=Pedobacter sp. TaxID=1411316 RepID=UPI002BFDF653|nr:GNAT family N-acetyltransferase [Pedobacter sp.]HMI01140.1 GNAT family N-acetyltransferase [Pedobacter sp.]